MATIINTIRWATNSAELAQNLKEGLDQIEATKASAEKLVQTLSGDRLIAAAHKYVAAVQEMGGAAGVMAGAEKLSAGEKERINGLLDKAIQKYTLLGQAAPSALLQLYNATTKVVAPINELQQQTSKLVDQFSGRGGIQSANAFAAAVEKIGGVSKLTASESAQVNAALTTAIEKYKALGQQPPAAMLAIAEATKKAGESTGGWLPLLQEMGNSWVARIAEGVLLRDAVHEVINKLKEMILVLPELALKGAAVAEVEESFQHLTEQLGRTGATLVGALRTGTHNTITDFELMKVATKDLTAGLNLTDQQFGTLAKGAFALAKATGTDVKSALDTMNDAMLTGRTRALALLTGKIDVTKAEEDFAKALGKTADQLSDAGKLEAQRAAILKAVGEATERLGEQTDGLDEKVAQASTSWHNFEENLGKTIATSPVLATAMDGVKDAIVAAFGDTPQTAVKEISRLVDDAIVTLVSFGTTGVQVAGFLAKEFYATKVVFGDVLQGLQLLELGATKFEKFKLQSSDLLGLDPKTQQQIKDAQAHIDALTASTNARGLALQQDKKAEADVDATTAKYVETLQALADKVKAARDNTQNFVGPIQQEGAAHSAAAAAAGQHGDALFKLNEADKARAKAIADLNSANIALNETDQLVVITQHALGMSEGELAKYIGATEAQVRKVIKADEDRTREAALLGDLRRSIEKTANEQSIKEYEKWAAGVSKSADDVGKHIIDGAVEIGAAQKSLADVLAKQGLSAWDYQVVKIQEWATSAKGAFKGTADQATAFYDLIDREAAAKIADIDSDWATLKANSTTTLQHTADLAAATYDYMLEHADEFSAGTIEKFKQIAKAAQDAADGNQHAWINSFTRIGEAIPGLIQQAFTGGGGIEGAARAAGSLAGAEFGKGLVTHLTETAPDFMGSALGKIFGSAIPVIGSLLGPLLGKLFSIGGPSQLELDGRKLEASFEAQFGSFQKMLTAVGAVYTATGRTFEQAQADVKALMDAERLGGDAAQAAIDKINGAFDEQKQDAADLQAAIQKYGFSIEQLGPALQKQKLDDQAKEILNSWRLLVGSGIDIVAVDQKMASTTWDYLQMAKRTGQEVPAAMKPILQSMLDQGVFTDENGDKLTDLGQLGLTFSETMTEGFDKVVAKLQQLLEGLGLVPKALDKIPSSKDIDITTHYQTDGTPREIGGGTPLNGTSEGIPGAYAWTGGYVERGGILPFARGGIVPQYLDMGGWAKWQPRGTDTVPAMLTPGEMVLNRDQQAEVFSMPSTLLSPVGALAPRTDGMDATSRSSRSGDGSAATPTSTGGDLRVVLMLDSRVIQEQVIRNVQLNKDGSYTKLRGALGLTS